MVQEYEKRVGWIDHFPTSFPAAIIKAEDFSNKIKEDIKTIGLLKATLIHDPIVSSVRAIQV